MVRPQSMLLFLIPGGIILFIIGALLLRDTPTPILEATFGEAQLISSEIDGPKRVYSSDIDGDSDMDVLAISLGDHKIAWYENKNGDGSVWEANIISTDIDGGDGISTADIDGDGDMDALSASSGDGKVAWYENLDGLGSFGAQNMINPVAPMAYFIVAVDFDGDQDKDVLYDAWDLNMIAWQENLDGQGTFGQVNIITDQANGASSVYAADVDGDGDMDALATAATGNKIEWYENTDGQGTFSAPKIITSAVDFPYSVIAADLDFDGDQDVLSASAGDDKIAWYENLDGNGAFGYQQIISDNALQAAAVYAADLDRDGDLDVLSASSSDDTIAWYENDGTGTFGTPKIITDQADFTFSVIASDLDNDNDLDIIVSAVEGDEITWYENLSPKRFYFPIIGNSK